MPETAAIDEALVDLLQEDPTLAAVMPDGVYWDAGPPNATRLVVVSRVSQVDVQGFDGRPFDDVIYSVRAVALSTLPGANADARTAEARIDALITAGTLTASGYTFMAARRRSPIHLTVVDDVDPSIRWFYRGGEYQIVMST